MAIAGKRQHIRQGARLYFTHLVQVSAVIEHHLAVVLLDVGFNGDGHEIAVYRHAVRRSTFGGGINGAELDRHLRVLDVQHVHGRIVGIDDKQTLVGGIVSHDFRCAFIESTTCIGAEGIQLNQGLAGAGRTGTAIVAVITVAGRQAQGGCEDGCRKE